MKYMNTRLSFACQDEYKNFKLLFFKFYRELQNYDNCRNERRGANFTEYYFELNILII